MSFDEAQNAFYLRPCKENAGEYLYTALEKEAEGEIGDDEFLNAVHDVAEWLGRLRLEGEVVKSA